MFELKGLCLFVVCYMIAQDHILIEVAGVQNGGGHSDLPNIVVHMKFA